MALLIDPPRWVAHGRRWSHLVSDSSFAELHEFATALGLTRRMFEGDHYDVPEERYHEVVDAGAQPVDSRELVHRLRSAGLRRHKRRGETVLASVDLPDGGRVDTVLSRLPALPAPSAADHLLVLRHGGALLACVGEEGLELPRSARSPRGGSGAVDVLAPLGLVIRRGPDGAIRAVQQVLLVECRSRRPPAWPELEGAQWYPAERVLATLPPWLAPLLVRRDG
jgi:hypothetical protein